MTTDPLEKQLREMPWRRPPASLKERIFCSPPTGRTTLLRLIFRRPVGLGWAAALMACAAIIGYGVGRQHRSPASAPVPLEQTQLRIIETGVSRNFFDLTQESEDPWPGPMRLEIERTPDANG